jgi:hypothetical protein
VTTGDRGVSLSETRTRRGCTTRSRALPTRSSVHELNLVAVEAFVHRCYRRAPGADIMSETSTSTSLTSLLASLHIELQAQTQLLPTLHAQLGLPPSALEDDLGALQKQLIQSVEDQVKSRRDEVEGWMDRCNTLEEDCLRYCNALGGHIKATGSTVGELRKEQVLPRRFEHVMAYQAKLQKVRHYEAKR